MSEKKKYDTLVLSGGGIKGFYLLGAVQAIIDNDLYRDINIFVGTSIGSIISYLLAIGYTPIEIVVSLYTERYFERLQSFNLIAMINGNGAISFTNVNESLEKLTLKKIGKFLTLGKLKELGKTLICTSYNMTTCITEYIGPDNYPDIPCLTAIRMSCNIPLVFDRFQYMNNYYIDGGLTDNFPILKGDEIGTNVLGLYLMIDEKTLKDVPEEGVMSYLLRLWQIQTIQNTTYKNKNISSKCTIIPIDTSVVKNFMDFDIKSKTRLDMFSNGYESIKNNLK